MIKYLIIHNKHEGCYDFQYYEDEVEKIRLTSITINPPKIFMFNNKDQAQDFFEEYVNDIDVIDLKCKKDDEVDHADFCTCGIYEFDDDDNPILFYNKKNQIFLMEHGPQIFVPPQGLKNDMKNLNLTNRLIRKRKTLSRVQRKKYIELGKYCQECANNDNDNNQDSDEDTDIDTVPVPVPVPVKEVKPEILEENPADKKDKVSKEKVQKEKKEKKEKVPKEKKEKVPKEKVTKDK
jgi:hypothetical protein